MTVYLPAIVVSLPLLACAALALVGRRLSATPWIALACALGSLAAVVVAFVFPPTQPISLFSWLPFAVPDSLAGVPGPCACQPGAPGGEGGALVDIRLFADAPSLLFGGLAAIAASLTLGAWIWARPSTPSSAVATGAGARDRKASEVIPVLAILATALAVFFAGNVVTMVLAWFLVAVVSFWVAERGGSRTDGSRSWFILDLTVGAGLLAFLFPESAGVAPFFAVVAGLARLGAYPFVGPRQEEEGGQSPALILQRFLWPCLGLYVIVRVVALNGGLGTNQIGYLTLIGAIGLLYAMYELNRQTSWSRVVRLVRLADVGLMLIALGSGSYGALAAALLILVASTLSALSLDLSALSRDGAPLGLRGNVPALVSHVSLLGIPPFAGMWGRWMLLSVLVASGQVLQLVVVAVAIVVCAWRGANAFSMVLESERDRHVEPRTGGIWSRALLMVPVIGLSLFVAPVFNWFIEPAIIALTSKGAPLTSVALPMGDDALSGWLAFATLILLVGLLAFAWRCLPLTAGLGTRLNLMAYRKLHLAPNSAPRVLLSLPAVTPRSPRVLKYVQDPGRLVNDLARAAHSVGTVVTGMAREVEMRYLAPGIVLGMLAAFLLFVGG